MVSPGQGGDATLRRVGAHAITIDPSGTPKKAGFTKGSLAITLSPDKRIITAAEYGSNALDMEILGVQASVKWTMLERSLKILDIALQGLYPANYLSATTSRGIGRSGVRTGLTLTGGESGRGKKILLHPLWIAGTTYDITLFNAVVLPTGAVELSDQGDQMWEVEATCLIDSTQVDGMLLLQINDPNAGT